MKNKEHYKKTILQRKFPHILIHIHKAIIDLHKHGGVEYGGYLAFLTTLAIFPFIAFTAALISLAGRLYLDNYFNQDLLYFLTDIILSSQLSPFIDTLKPRLIEISSAPPKTFLTIAIVSAIWTASSMFDGIRTILNRAYRVNNPPHYILRRIFSIFEFLFATFIILVVLMGLALIPKIIDVLYQFEYYTNRYYPQLEQSIRSIYNAQSIRYLTSTMITFFLVSSIYRSLPNIKIKFKDTIPGTIITICGWWLFSQIFFYYITTFSQINFIYGSITGIVITLFFFHICAIIFIFGAEFNYQLSRYQK